MKPVRDVCKDVRKTQVVLWGRRGQLWKIHVCPSLEPDARSLVHAKGEWLRENLRGFDCDGLEEGQDVAVIVCNGGQRLGNGRLGGGLLRIFVFFDSGALTVTTLSLLLASSASLGGVASDAHSMMERTKVFSSSPEPTSCGGLRPP